MAYNLDLQSKYKREQAIEKRKSDNSLIGSESDYIQVIKKVFLLAAFI